ncbi:hypothetical protein ACIBQ0_17115 [Nocardia nova]|uniref:hypothetical protein n=1 Tax=Nocardia nova TaxID=37330 RepID=UPI0037B0A5E0
MSMPDSDAWIKMVNATAELIAEDAVAAERARADKWMKLGRKYDDIRDWIRTCPDTPEGHAEFYNECARIIFGEQS